VSANRVDKEIVFMMNKCRSASPKALSESNIVEETVLRVRCVGLHVNELTYNRQASFWGKCSVKNVTLLYSTNASMMGLGDIYESSNIQSTKIIISAHSVSMFEINWSGNYAKQWRRKKRDSTKLMLSS